MLEQPKIIDEEYIALMEDKQELKLLLKERNDDKFANSREFCYICQVINDMRYNEEKES